MTISQILAQYKRDFSNLLKYWSGPDNAVIIDYFIDDLFIDYKKLINILFTDLLLDVNIEPVINGLPKVSFVDSA